jgi:hypothetical protein
MRPDPQHASRPLEVRGLMARSSARNVKPSLSNEPRDKLLAALNWS